MSIARRLLAPLAATAAAALLAAGCGKDDTASAGEEALVVATTTQVADFARNVAGDRAAVTGLLAPNTDPHDYEVRPRDVEALADADLIVRSGGDLDEWLQEAIEGSGSDAQEVTVIDIVPTIQGGHEEEEAEGGEDAEEVDPHWWQDPRNAETAVKAIRDGLIEADPDGRSTYEANADAYLVKLRALDEAIQECVENVPPEQRKLVTTHDAFGYYARRFGIEIVGAVIPSLSTQGQPSAGETAELVQTIRREGVKAIFAERSVNAKVEQAIADETGAKIGEPLFADSLGPQGSGGETYLQALAADTQAMVDGFTGGEQSCSLPR